MDKYVPLIIILMIFISLFVWALFFTISSVKKRKSVNFIALVTMILFILAVCIFLQWPVSPLVALYKGNRGFLWPLSFNEELAITHLTTLCFIIFLFYLYRIPSLIFLTIVFLYCIFPFYFSDIVITNLLWAFCFSLAINLIAAYCYFKPKLKKYSLWLCLFGVPVIVLTISPLMHAVADRTSLPMYTEDKTIVAVSKDAPEFMIGLNSGDFSPSYLWSLHDYDSHIVELDKQFYKSTPRFACVVFKCAGAEGKDIWIFHVKQAGFSAPIKTTIRFTRPDGKPSELIFRVTN